MVLMLVRTALWGLAVIAAAIALVWLKDSSGGVMVELNGRAFGPFRPLEFVAVVFVLALLIWGVVKLFGFLVALVRFASGDETALSRYWSRSRERRGFDALANGLTALAEGDASTALVRGRKAERLLEKPGLTKLLVAQAAEQTGETRLARDYYKQLASDPKTAYVGVKGLLDQALAKGETERALKLARHAFELKPKDKDLLTRLFELQCETADWSGARTTLAAMVKARMITRDVADRREAVLLVADARAAAGAGEDARSHDLAARALKKSPGLVPAVVDVAAGQVETAGVKRAARTLREAWRAEPHPDIAAAFAALVEDETPAERRTRFEDLTKTNPNHPESRMLTAELALADRDWGAARKAMGDLAETNPSARAFSIMAAVEKGEAGDDALVRAWLARAVSAPRAPQWTCANCGARHKDWGPRCGRCEAFDTLDWRGTEADPEAEGASMLPVLMEVDPPEAPAPDTPADADGAPPPTDEPKPTPDPKAASAAG